MNVRKVKEIVKFDVEKSIQNKWFVILNVFAFIAILIATNWSNIQKYMDEHNIDLGIQEEFTIQVVDNENLVLEDIQEAFKDEKNIKIEKVEANEYSKENMPKKELLLVEVNSDPEKIINIKLVSKESVDGNIYDKIYELLVETRSKIFAAQKGVTVEELDVLNENLQVKREMLGVDAENSDQKQAIKLVATIIMYMCLLIVLGRIANEIANEKVSKSIEYVLTSVSEKEYLLAKVLSSTLTIVVQLIYTIIYYMIGNAIASFATTGSTIDITANVVGNLDKGIVSYILAMIGYLIFTVFLTTLIQAALSSKTTSVAEAGNTTMLLVMVVVALYILSNGMIDPYTKVTPVMYVISCIPIVSTFFVPSMMIIGQSTTLQVIISFVVLVISIPLVFNWSAKVFKNGVLDYTSKKKRNSLFNLAGNKKSQEMTLREEQEIDLRKSKARKYAFSIGMAVILFVILQVFFTLVFGFTLPTYLKGKLDNTTILLIENSLILICALGLASLFIKVYSTEELPKKENMTSFQKFEVYFIGITFALLIQLLCIWLLPKLGINGGIIEKVGLTPSKTFWGVTLFIINIAVVPAIFEEIFFRKWVLNTSRKYGSLFAVVFSSLLFGIYHMNLSQGIFAFLLGLVLGTIVVKTGTIKYGVIIHFLNNAAAAIGMIYGEQSIAYQFTLNIFIAISVVGAILIIKNLPNLKKIKKENWKISEDCKYLLRNYTFILSMILMVVLLAATERMIH